MPVLEHGQEVALKKGTMRLDWSHQHTPLITVTGFFHAGEEVHLIDTLDSILRDVGQVHAFYDWEEMRGYDPEVRKNLADYANAQEGKILSSHFLIRSGIVALGVALANKILRTKLQVYNNRKKFEQALQEARASRAE